jgi:hypothetical protein
VHQRCALFLIGLMWLWTGIAYHWLFFSEINRAALLFGLLFVVEGLLLIGFALKTMPMEFRWRSSPAGWLGAALLAYSLVIYPLIDLLLGHWPRMPWFGVSPCPVTLFTLAMLSLAAPRPASWLWAIPITWSIVGGTAAFLLAVPQDWILLASGPVAVLIAFRSDGGWLRAVREKLLQRRV